ncbi:MAG: lysozyme inhibitor LprI family protein [Chitinophagaceae bacterium]|nr:DUF1311 domain-containing protein [Chitinophagaceae bacterium]
MKKLKINERILMVNLLVISMNLSSYSQSLKTLVTMENQYQSCLDLGQNMVGCSEYYYYQIDSFLNVIYKKIMSSIDSSEKVRLRKKQREWLVLRDKQFSQIGYRYIKTKSQDAKYIDEDSIMITFDKKAEIVEKRIRELFITYSIYFCASSSP